MQNVTAADIAEARESIQAILDAIASGELAAGSLAARGIEGGVDGLHRPPGGGGFSTRTPSESS